MADAMYERSASRQTDQSNMYKESKAATNLKKNGENCLFYLDADGSATVVSIFIKLVLYIFSFLWIAVAISVSVSVYALSLSMLVPLNEYTKHGVFGEFAVLLIGMPLQPFGHSVRFRSVFIHKEKWIKKYTRQLQHLIHSVCVIAPRKSICWYIICCRCCQQIILLFCSLLQYFYLPHSYSRLIVAFAHEIFELTVMSSLI